MPRDLAGRAIIITGASAGIGAATALACARAGMNLVLNARRADALEIVANQCRALGRQVECIAGDITDAGVNTQLLDAATTRLGGSYAVFANAGYGFHQATHEMSGADLRRIFEVNFFSGVDLLSQAARRVIAAGSSTPPTDGPRAHLLMCSSALAKFTLPYFAAYSATKAAQNHICRAMRLELRSHRIEVSSVHPITTETEFFNPETLVRQGIRAHQPKMNAPRAMVQRPQLVADAIVRALHHPRPEVWTSTLARIPAVIFAAFPRLFDSVARRIVGG